MGIIVLETSFHYMEKSMNKRDYKPRLIDRKLEEYLNTFGAVCWRDQSGVEKHGHLLITAIVRL